MLILTNCLTETADEGCLKTANSIVKRIKAVQPETKVVSYERRSAVTDVYVKSNKLLLTRDIIKILRKCNQDVLYIPFPARSQATALRIFTLCLFAPKKVKVLFSQITDVSLLAGILFRICGADFIVLSDDTCKKFEPIAGKKRVKRIKAGVQTDKFVPVTPQTAAELKVKYGLLPDRPVVLHVGHLNEGRNVVQLMKISEKYQVLLVTSTLTKDEQDLQLKARLLGCSNIKIIEDFLPEIQEIYQLSDVYFFPVEQEGKCIDSPLSCLEAASCNKPIVTTDFGEMKEFRGKEGFYFIESFESEKLNLLIDKAAASAADTRRCVYEYDWSNAISNIL